MVLLACVGGLTLHACACAFHGFLLLFLLVSTGFPLRLFVTVQQEREPETTAGTRTGEYRQSTNAGQQHHTTANSSTHLHELQLETRLRGGGGEAKHATATAQRRSAAHLSPNATPSSDGNIHIILHRTVHGDYSHDSVCLWAPGGCPGS